MLPVNSLNKSYSSSISRSWSGGYGGFVVVEGVPVAVPSHESCESVVVGVQPFLE